MPYIEDYTLKYHYHKTLEQHAARMLHNALTQPVYIMKEEVMSKPSFYLAGKYSDRELLQGYASILRANGFYVNAEWLEGCHEERSDKAQLKYAQADLNDIRNSTRFVMVQNEQPSAGRNFEMGYAHAQGKPLVVIGPRTSVFHYLTPKQYDTFEDFITALREEYPS